MKGNLNIVLFSWKHEGETLLCSHLPLGYRLCASSISFAHNRLAKLVVSKIPGSRSAMD